MFGRLIVVAVIAAQALFVRADPNPTVPGPGNVYNEGSSCQIQWNVDTNGTWTQMTIQLMTGNNFNMIPLTTVATVDATKTTSFTYPCPSVSPNSAIYFYQFKDAVSNNTYWTTRFAIADASGATTPPAQSTQPNGQQIPWGTGVLLSGGSSSLSGGSSSLIGGSSSIPSSGGSSIPSIPPPLSSLPAPFQPSAMPNIASSSSLRQPTIAAVPSAGSVTSGAIIVDVRQASSILAVVLAAATSILML